MSIPNYIVVTGTSAGGLKALTAYVSNFDKDMDAAVFIVMHLASTATSDFLLSRLQPLTSFICHIAGDGAPIEKGHIYIAAANTHLFVQKDSMKLGYGPEENRWKPSVDVLFRSAAANWSNRSIGVILSGMLNDGAVGMKAIKGSGGTCIIQDPKDAEYPEMPLSVLQEMHVDHSLPATSIGQLLSQITAVPVGKIKAAPKNIIIESAIAEKLVTGYNNIEQLGTISNLACPDCGGGLYKISEATSDRYRCHIGHAYTEEELGAHQTKALETTLWVALRMMEERKTLLQKMKLKDEIKGYRAGSESYQKKIESLETHIEKLKELLHLTSSFI